MSPPSPVLIFHMTHVTNVPGIVAHGGLATCATLQQSGLNYSSVADGGIQDRRSRCVVPCGPGGVVHDYVPFYFAARSPMLFRLNKNPEQCPGGQDAMVYLVSRAESVYAAGLPCVFSDGHAIMGLSQFFTEAADLSRVDWEVMKMQQWTSAADPDRVRRRQAEFLVHRQFPWDLVDGIGVRTSAAQADLLETLRSVGCATPVAVRPAFYY